MLSKLWMGAGIFLIRKLISVVAVFRNKTLLLSCLLFILFLFSLSVHLVHATVVSFPEQELPKEYIFPVFDDPHTLLHRNVSLNKRFELRLSSAFRTDEPLYFSLSLAGSLVFFFNELNGIGVSGLFFIPGLSRTGTKLRTDGATVKYDTTPSAQGTSTSREERFYFDPLLAPHPLFASFLNYYYSPIYGKISITKKLVFNFSLYGYTGLGVVGFTHGDFPINVFPALDFGFGQRLYFNRYFGLDIGIDFLLYRGPNPIADFLKWGNTEEPPQIRSYNYFKKDVFIRFLTRIGLVILL